jgi:hypothetical protein
MFQHCAQKRPGTSDGLVLRTIVDPETYQRWPETFTEDMEKGYKRYKDAGKSCGKMMRVYRQVVKSYGGIQQMTWSQHSDMLELVKGSKDEQRGRVNSGPLVFAYNLSVFSK